MKKVEIDRAELDEIVETVGSVREAMNRLGMSDRRYFGMAQTMQALFDRVSAIQERGRRDANANELHQPQDLSA